MAHAAAAGGECDAGTLFAALAAAEVAGKSAAASVSGLVAESLGYSGLFAVSTAASLCTVALSP